MLDLDTIFDPDRVEAVIRTRFFKSIGPDDLPGDWRVEWEERAAIIEYDGGLPREHAEALALDIILKEMHKTGVKLRNNT